VLKVEDLVERSSVMNDEREKFILPYWHLAQIIRDG
jgi:hypothetical protein